IEHFHHVIVGAVERNFAAPHGARAFNLHTRIGHDDSWTAPISKACAKAIKNTKPTTPPRTLKTRCNEIGRGIPVLTLNRPEKVLGLTPPLPLRLPQPNEIDSYAKSDDQPATK